MATKYPKTLGAAVDTLYRMRAKRIDKQRELDEMKAEEKELSAHIMAGLGKQRMKGVRGAIATASRSSRQVAVVEDWDQFYAYIHKKKAYEMLERRPAVKAVAERSDAGVEVPGVSLERIATLNLVKSTRS